MIIVATILIISHRQAWASAGSAVDEESCRRVSYICIYNICVYIYIYIYTHTYTCIHMYTHTHIYIYIYICQRWLGCRRGDQRSAPRCVDWWGLSRVYKCIKVYKCVHIYIERERERGTCILYDNISCYVTCVWQRV